MIDDPDLVSDARTRIGAVLCGKYRLDGILGIGGMATVYAATHRNHAELAVKVLHRELAADPSVRERFLREAYAVNSIKHRGVVKIVDDDVAEDGSAFLVMDRLEGETAEELRERCGGKLPVAAAVSITEQLLDALGAAHAEGIVHRDVKPPNVFVTTDGEVKVLDFGIARTRDALAGGLSVTGTAAVMGTPTYMAPEQALGGTTDIDERTDVWAVGATLFVLLSGRYVHDADSAADLVAKAAMNAAPSLETVMPRAPRAIVEVVDVALAFEKASRWATARDMRIALLAAHRLHYGNAPLRPSLARLVEPPSSGVVRVERAHAHTIPRLPSSWRRDTPPPLTAPEGEVAAVSSRTSIPLALDEDRGVVVAAGRTRVAVGMSAVVAAIVITVAARWTTSSGSVEAPAAASAPWERTEPVDAAGAPDAEPDGPGDR